MKINDDVELLTKNFYWLMCPLCNAKPYTSHFAKLHPIPVATFRRAGCSNELVCAWCITHIKDDAELILVQSIVFLGMIETFLGMIETWIHPFQKQVHALFVEFTDDSFSIET